MKENINYMELLVDRIEMLVVVAVAVAAVGEDKFLKGVLNHLYEDEEKKMN
jgi:nitrogen fixation-related uncharacterized protein